MTTQAPELVYAGKAKSLYRSEEANKLIMDFRDDTTAFDGEKSEKLTAKGRVNNHFNAFIMEKLAASGVPTHFERRLSDTKSLVKHLKMIPVECVIRNIAAGSLCRRLGIESGIVLNPPIFEFFLKDDARHDPMINRSHIKTFGWATEDEVNEMQRLTEQVNTLLQPLFLGANLLLVDYKLEFGRFEGKLYLGDEFTPDGCRLWDKTTRESLDKDRFRQNLGGVVESYKEVAERLGVAV